MEVIPENPLLEFLPDTLEAIRKVYNLENGRMGQSVNILEEWVKKQSHFVNKNISRASLEKTIVACKGSVEKAKKQVDNLCTFKTLMPKYFTDTGIKEIILKINNLAFSLPLPKMTKEYDRIYFVRFDTIGKEIKSADFLDYYRYTIFVAEYLKAHDYPNGFIMIEDFRSINITDILTKINFIEFQEYMSILTEGYGARMKGIHLITHSKAIDMFVNSIKAMLTPKLASRVHVHTNPESIHKIVDKSLLPLEYGGDLGPMTNIQEKWTDILCSEENKKYLAEMKASCTNESFRQKDKFNEQYMGLPGSFRTFTVD